MVSVPVVSSWKRTLSESPLRSVVVPISGSATPVVETDVVPSVSVFVVLPSLPVVVVPVTEPLVAVQVTAAPVTGFEPATSA